jgi:short chain dehydrogenase
MVARSGRNGTIGQQSRSSRVCCSESAMTAHDPKKLPPQSQDRQPGRESQMIPKPEFEPRFRGADKLKDKVALITGGDSGIGRAVAVHMAREGADIAIVYLEEDNDAAETASFVEAEGQRCLTISGDVSREEFCKEAVSKVLEQFGHLDSLVNNAAEQHTTVGDGPLDNRTTSFSGHSRLIFLAISI